MFIYGQSRKSINANIYMVRLIECDLAARRDIRFRVISSAGLVLEHPGISPVRKLSCMVASVPSQRMNVNLFVLLCLDG